METIFETKEEYLQFKENWKHLCNDEDAPKLCLHDFIIYAILRGRDWKICLSPNSKDETLEHARFWAEEKNPKYINLSKYGANITEEKFLEARRICMEKYNA